MDLSRFRGYLNWISKNTKGPRQAALQMDTELRGMEDRWFNQNITTENVRYHGTTINPDQSCYGVVAEAFAKSNWGIEGARKAAAVLDRYCDRNGNVAGVVLYTTVMKAWALADEFSQAREILLDMEKRYTESADERMAPDMIAYTVYLNVLSETRAKSGHEIAAEAMELLREMHEKADSGQNLKAQPNTYTYTAAMKCLARARDYDGVQRLFAELKQRMEDAPEHLKGSYRPGKLVYGTMIGIYAESDLGDEGADRADELLQELLAQYAETNDILYRPNPFIYASVLTAQSKSSGADHVQKALRNADAIMKQCKRDEHLAQDPKLFEAGMSLGTVLTLFASFVV